MPSQYQFIRYAIVGLASNLVLYITYLWLTLYGVEIILAMSLVYIFGICLTFGFNRKWTFNHKGHIPKAFFRYVLIYVVGYVVQLLGLYVFVDVLGYPHQLIMALLIVIVAVILFVLQKTVVFKKNGVETLKKINQ